MAPHKQVSPAWARRNELARLRGYQSYYDYRAHNYGKLPSTAPRVRGEALRRLRGHSSRKGLDAFVRDGDIVTLQGSSERNRKGQFTWIEISVYTTRGQVRTFRLTGPMLQRANLERLLDQLEKRGALITLVYPPDLIRL